MTAFLVIGVLGLVVLVVALVVGDLSSGVFDGLGGDWFSTEVVGAFVAALGFGGALALQVGAPEPVAVLAGGAAGVAFGAGAAWLTDLVRSGGTEGTPSSADVVGQEGSVVSAIPDDGLGTVQVRLGGHTLRYHARCAGGLDAGTRVNITEVLSPTAVSVSPVWSPSPPSD